MTRWQQTLEVARWEFARFVKLKQQFVGLALMLAFGLGGSWVGRRIKQAELKPVPVAVVNAAALGFALPDAPPVAWDTSRVWTEEAAREAVQNETLKGALVVRGAQEAEIVVRRRAEWTESLTGALTAARQGALLARLAATTPEGAALMAPFTVNTALLGGGTASEQRANRVAALVVLFIGFTLVLTGFGTLFTGITGEKQHRVTEQLVAMVPPQVWMDGKILGLTAAGLVGSLITFGGGFALYRVLPLLLGRDPFPLPAVATAPMLLVQIGVITLLGVLMWYAFMAAIAATIDDPNSSTRSLLLFVPAIPMAAALALTSKLDTGIGQALAIFPLTSSAVLPMRLAVTTVAAWEVPVAVVLLIAAGWLFRRVAGKIFGTAMLMYGKEPSMRELWRWMRAS